MPFPIYATPDELAQWITGDPDATAGENAATYTLRIRNASRMVQRTIESAVYATDGDSLPTDTDKLEATNSSCLTQAAAWIAAGIDPGQGASQLKRAVASKSASGGGGTLSVTYLGQDYASDYLTMLATSSELIPDALAYLLDAGLVSSRVTVLGGGAPDTYLVGTVYDPLTGSLKP